MKPQRTRVRPHSIQIKMGFFLLTLTTLILFGFGLYQYVELKASKTASLNNLAGIVIDELAENLAFPLWNCGIMKRSRLTTCS